MNEENSNENLISDHKKQEFTWIKIYREKLFPQILKYEKKQSELAKLISESLQGSSLNFGKDKDQSKSENEQEIDHTEIDPFTVIRSLNASSLDKRCSIHNTFLQKIGCTGELFKEGRSEDFKSLPKTENNKWFYPFKCEKTKDGEKLRDINQITFIWKYFKQLVNGNELNSEDGQQLLKYDQITIHKLSQVLYCINPTSYIPLDQPFNSFLSEKGILKLKLKNGKKEIECFKKNENFEIFDPSNFQNYLDILQEIQKDIPGREFYELYSEAACSYESNKNQKKNKGNKDMLNDSNNSLNQILYGPAGTGKTYNTINHALAILKNKSLEALDKEVTEACKTEIGEVSDIQKRKKLQEWFNENLYKSNENGKQEDAENAKIRFVTFHQSYGYEEFVEGIKVKEKDGKISYSVESGVFKKLCTQAKANLTDNYVLIIDEINRGNISKIFGELITLIEDSKREGNNESLSVTLPYSGESFSVPNNLYIIGTMNSSDRSLTSLDLALRRRFEFIEMQPNPEVLRDIKIKGLDDKIEIKAPSNNELTINGTKIQYPDIKNGEKPSVVEVILYILNKRIKALLDQDHCIGHANFRHLTSNSTVQELMAVFEKKIIPLLQEYFFNDWEKINLVLGNNGMIIKDTIDPNLFPSDFSPQVERLNSRSWKINTILFKATVEDQIKSLKQIISPQNKTNGDDA